MPTRTRPPSGPRRVAIVTGTRAEFGLLAPVMHAVDVRRALTLSVVVCGSHLLPPGRTIREVADAFEIAAVVPMQRPGVTGRAADARALGRGISGLALAFERLKPDWVVVLGDRIEALAAAAGASVAGIAVCHIHGGDRAEGIADDSMRHAISKLSHLHCAATQASARRLVRLGEDPERVLNTGSPSIDALATVGPMNERGARALGNPAAVLLMHPSSAPPGEERRWLNLAAKFASAAADGGTLLWLEPNHDPGREVVLDELARALEPAGTVVRREAHLPRERFVALLKRLASRRGPGGLIGNSSAGLIEAATLGVGVVNLGPRQAGRERAGALLDLCDLPAAESLDAGERARALRTIAARAARRSTTNPYGDGRAAHRIACALETFDPRSPDLLRKRIAY